MVVSHIARNHFLTCNIEANDQNEKKTNAHLGEVMKATEGGFEEISLPALTFKCLYLALLLLHHVQSVKK